MRFKINEQKTQRTRSNHEIAKSRKTPEFMLFEIEAARA